MVKAENLTDTDITKEFADQQVTLSSKDIIDVRDIFFEQIDYLLFASSTSMGALIDISRRIKKKYLNQDFHKKFDETNLAIANDTTGLFIRELRNFIIHGNELPLGLNHHYRKGEGWTDHYVLNAEPIKEYLHNKNISTFDQFLLENEKGIKLSPMFYTYNVAMYKVWMLFLDDLVKYYEELGGNENISRH
jgi:hypothetical protein